MKSTANARQRWASRGGLRPPTYQQSCCVTDSRGQQAALSSAVPTARDQVDIGPVLWELQAEKSACNSTPEGCAHLATKSLWYLIITVCKDSAKTITKSLWYLIITVCKDSLRYLISLQRLSVVFNHYSLQRHSVIFNHYNLQRLSIVFNHCSLHRPSVVSNH